MFDSKWWFADVPGIQRYYPWPSRQLFRALFRIAPLRRLGRGPRYHFPG